MRGGIEAAQSQSKIDGVHVVQKVASEHDR